MSAGAITLNDIISADWSLALDANTLASVLSFQSLAQGSGIGNVVQGIADINQCIGIILSTPKGSDPFRPTFACDIWQFLDLPMTVARPQLVREIVEALTKWEPRIRVLSVIIEGPTPDAISQLIVTITWQLKIDTTRIGNQQVTITIPQTLV